MNLILVFVYSFLIDVCVWSIFVILELYFDIFLLILFYYSDYIIVNIFIFESCDIEGLEKKDYIINLFIINCVNLWLWIDC